ncbi:CBS domain-containing protein [Paenibacillus odorifer]|uniref:CBS domain-containing protein n=1 Tax=Paenibacillus TaxID=44249 RepID=UPI00096EE4F1|nr:CBS domain-containing protein [Paenibacillus odorifer]OMC69394.1 CBS domain-containing protein [Paenibacillus odorifer]OMC75021.1 CBS domain-containing protein [Paenibacillus odorifer]OME41362.1 CBS domain-containing protein [Paenibacillus odorifer]
MKTVKEVMTKEPATVTLQDNVYEVAVKMRDYDTGFIPVVDNEEHKTLLGVITDRDLVIRGYAAKHPGSTSVETVMSKEIQTVSENTSVDEAAEVMAGCQIRRLAVTRDQKLVGVVSIGDLAVRDIFADEAGEALHDISQQHLH